MEDSLAALVEKHGGTKDLTDPTTPPATPTDPVVPNEPIVPTGDPAPQGDPIQQPKYIAPHEIFGDEYKDKDWDVAKEELSTKLNRVKEIETRLQELESATPAYANDEVAAYDAWIKNGGTADYELFQTVKNFKSEEADDIDKVVAQQLLMHPELKPFKDKIKEKLINDYGLVSTDDNELSDEQIAFNKVNFKSKVQQAEDFLKQQSDKLKIVEAPKAKLQEVIAQREQGWMPEVEKALTFAHKIQIPTIVKEGDKYVNAVAGEYELPEKVMQQYKAELIPQLTKAYSEFTDPTPEAINQVKAQVLNRVIIDNLPWMISQVQATTEKKVIDEYDKKYNGGVIPKAPGSASTGGDPNNVKAVMGRIFGD